MASRFVKSLARRTLAIAANSNRVFVIADEVANALRHNQGVVALESTVITHGLPYPENLRTAESLEAIVRDAGGVPATIAVIGGCVHVGLDHKQMITVATANDSCKVSTRDLPYAMAKNRVGGTTVAATAYIAHKSGIRVFATGGIGGVHRGAGESFDISADLIELSRTPVAVVCAGVKSILDVGKTLEYLETHSVNVVVYGKTKAFPGFFTRDSGFEAPFSTDSIEEIVYMLKRGDELNLPNGTIIACPIPHDHEAIAKCVEDAIQQAVQESRDQRIIGQASTPYILKRVNELTKGQSMITNIALLQNNARIAAEIAVAFQRGKNDQQTTPSSLRTRITTKEARKNTDDPKNNRPRVVCIGATLVDFEAITERPLLMNGGTLPGAMMQRCGGVGRNHADALTRLGISTALISAIGRDSHVDFVRDYCRHMNLEHVAIIDGHLTASYLSFAVNGIVQFGIFANENIVQQITPQMIRCKEDLICAADFVVVDANLTVETLRAAIEIAHANKTKVWFDPTDLAKAQKLHLAEESSSSYRVEVISPNANEFVTYCRTLGIRLESTPDVLSNRDALSELIYQHSSQIMDSRLMVIVSLGANGTLIARYDEENRFQIDTFPAPEFRTPLRSVSGAGDCFNSGLLAGLLTSQSWDKCVRMGQACAARSLESTHAVPDTLDNLFTNNNNSLNESLSQK